MTPLESQATPQKNSLESTASNLLTIVLSGSACRLLAPLGQQASLDQEGERDCRRTTTSMTVSPAFLPSSRAVWALSTTAAVDSTGTVLGGWKGTGFSGR